jgi:HD superfamily phosphodiesterase
MEKEKINEIKNVAIHLDWNIAFNGKSRGNRHLFRVNNIVEFLSEREGADKKIATAGAWLHDVGLINGNNNHNKVGKKIAKDILASIKVDNKDIKKILHCIEAHEGDVKAETKEAMIVHDADALDKMGSLGIIRHTWKLANEGFNTEEICKSLEKHLEKRKRSLYTKTAKAMAEEFNNKNFFELLKKQLDVKYLRR